METLAEKNEAKNLEQERRSEEKRINAINLEIKKYQTSIKDTQQKITDLGEKGELTDQARSQYGRMIEDSERTIMDYKMQIRHSQENLAEIYVRIFRLPPPMQRD